MSFEDVAEKADKWSQLITRITKSLAAAAIAVGTAIGGLVMLWPTNEQPVADPASIVAGAGYSPQCSQLMNSIDHNWTESQWSVWESLRKDVGC